MIEKNIVNYYENKKASDFEYVKEKSRYNHNYYLGLKNHLLYAKSDDEEITEWYISLNGKEFQYFGFSVLSEGDKIHLDTDSNGYFIFP